MKDSRIPETVLVAISEGTHIIRAYREHLGYSIQDLAVACGLAAEEIENCGNIRDRVGHLGRCLIRILINGFPQHPGGVAATGHEAGRTLEIAVRGRRR